MKKILMINTFYYPKIVGGAEKQIQILAESLVKRNYEVIIISLGNKEKVFFYKGVKIYSIKLPIINNLLNGNLNKRQKILWKLFDINNLFGSKKIQDILKKESPNIVHTHNISGFSTSIWEVIKKMNIPIIHTINDYFLLCIRSSMFKNGRLCKEQCLECRFASFFKKEHSLNIDATIGVSKFILDQHLDYRYFEYSKVKKYIYNPIDVTDNSKRINIKDGFVKFGYVGQMLPGKGLELLLDQFQKLEKNGKCAIYIYGSNSSVYAKNLRKKYKNKNINFMGFVPSKDIYKNIDVTIVPSLWNEPFGRIIPESYYYGIPVIASIRGGIPEIVIDGRTGFLFDPNKENDLKEKMKIFLENPKLIEEFSENCVEFVKKFNKEKIIDEYIKVYEQLIK